MILSSLLALASLVALPAAWPQEGLAEELSATSFLEHVRWMADDAREGRGTGTTGLADTAEYVARHFQRVGLQPGGDEGGYRQAFEAAGARELGEGNAMTLAGTPLVLGDDWIPFASSATGGTEGGLVFAGYGITDEDGGYDDYAGLDVSGKVVVVLRRGPGASLRVAAEAAAAEDGAREAAAAAHGAEDEAPGARYLDPAGKGRRMIDFGAKINTAFKAGAAGLIVVNDPATYPPGSEKDVTRTYGSTRAAGTSASLPAVHVTAAAAMRVLGPLGVDLEALQRNIDGFMLPASRDLPDAGSASIDIEAQRVDVTTENVVGVLPGGDPHLAHEYVLVGAHMDHLGRAERTGSMAGEEGRGAIHNGADDNASGTAGVLELARALSARSEPLPRTVVFVAFGAEEWGLLGSHHYVDHPTLPTDDLVAMVNMDMIGRSADGFLSIEGLGTAAGLEDLVNGAHERIGSPFELSLSDSVPGNSDQASFADNKIPVVALFTGLHDDYHRPSDDTEKINAEGGALAAALAGEILVALAESETRPVFTDPDAGKSQHAVAGSDDGEEKPASSGYRVVFGSVPDMTYTKDDGVRISSAKDGSPAAKAGLTKGDVIIALDGRAVRTLEDYATLLFSHRPGDEIIVRVRRGEEELDLTATLEARGGDS